ncbi:MAG: hypothetical protein N0C88_17220 [Candidatus Thiodiazotropha lotti]|uniref:Lipoprotein n=1 Tax=Candidatus Thiodiazotropha lotti TaxID=2792787 RepID=A0A9E4K820_9GAMM|nr:hypothetical protein [Candidatus Thiodiazotropha lotti]MCW4205044.1 hypothetical protein [Candidatus Thiodiazotropha lotti]
MKLLQIIAIASLSIGLFACEQLAPPQVFQMITTPDGKTLRLNTKSGETHLVTDQGLIHLSENNPVLVVGEYYEMSDADTDEKFLKYKGGGQFEKKAWAVRKVSD